MWFAYGPAYGEQPTEAESGYDGNWVELDVNRVKEIIEMNKGNSRPADLKEISKEILIAAPDYENVVGQDRIDRMIHKKKKKKRPQQRRQGGGENRSENRGGENRGGENKGGDNRPQNRGPQNRGPQNRGPQNRGPQNRGPQDRGPQNRGPQDPEQNK
jgi:hypothetical protein